MLQITPFRWIWPGAFLWALLLVLPAAAQTSIDAKQYLDADAPDGGIQAAVDAAAEAGGGEVVLPAGRFELRRSIMLKDGLTLRGQGPDETVLVGQPESQWVRISNVASNEAGGTKLTVEQLPEGIAVGSSVFAFSDRPLKGYLGYYVPLLVTAIEGNTLTVDQKVHNQPKWLEYGLMSPAKQDVSKGTDRIAVHEPTLFAVGEAIAMGRADGNNNESLSFIKAIEGDTLVLERPIRRDEAGSKRGKHGPAIWRLFPLITAESASNIAVRDLGLTWNIAPEARPIISRYTLSPIHLFNAKDSTIDNVKVTNSFADGISVQNGKNVTVSNSTVIGSRGNGLHPGTGLTRSQFINNHCEANGAGLYFCWHNTHLELRENRFVRNRGGGVTGLGFPGDRNNLLENNLIEDNGGPGIAIDGGGQNAGNVIRGNIIRDNSVAEPGKYGAIHMLARPEDVRGYVIEGNTIESTTDTPTQYIGIREQNGSHNGNEHFVDGNTIRNNQFAGHRVADVVTAGEATTVEGDSKVITDEAYQQQNEQ